MIHLTFAYFSDGLVKNQQRVLHVLKDGYVSTSACQALDPGSLA